MSSDAPGPRPRQVTVGGWLVAVASLLLVVTVFDTMTALRSVDTRDQLAAALDTPFWDQLGVSVGDAVGLIRAALYVAGVAAAVTGILGIFVLQRHAPARLVLTVAAVPVVLTAPVAGGVLAVVIGASTGLLWTRPARDWFAGRPPAPSPAGREGAGPAEEQPAPPAVIHVSSEQHGEGDAPGSAYPPPPPTHGWGQPAAPGQPPVQPPGQPPTYPAAPPYLLQPPLQQYAYLPARPSASVTERPPIQLRIACVITWVFSLFTGGLYLLLVLAIAVDRTEVVKLLRDNASVRDTSLTDDQLIGVLVAMSGVVILWCLAASLLAFLTWRRHGWAWVMLLVSVGVASLVELAGLPFSLVHLAACLTAFVLLLRAPVRAWIRNDRGPGSPGAWTAPPPAWQPPPPPTGQYPPPPPDQPSGKPPVW